jgi:hypothetical protein
VVEPLTASAQADGELRFIVVGPGGELRFTMNAPEPLVIHVEEATRPMTVRWTATDCPFLADWIGTGPTFSITPIDDRTSQVHFRQYGLTEELECIDMCTRSWDDYMTSRRDHLENGHGSPFGGPDQARRAGASYILTPSSTGPGRPDVHSRPDKEQQKPTAFAGLGKTPHVT